MAPVRKATATAHRETRSTRAAAVTKKKTTKAEKEVILPPSKPQPAVTKTVTATRRTRKTSGEQEDASELLKNSQLNPVEHIQPSTTRARSSRNTADTKTAARVATGLAAAPRRRIKITPLAQAESKSEKLASDQTEQETVSSEATKKTTRRTREATEKKPSEAMRTSTPVEIVEAPAPRRTRKGASGKAAEKPEDQKSGQPAPKTRGRPRKAATEGQAETSSNEPTVIGGRSTRTRAASSVTASQIESVVPVAAPVARKKVTFQDILDEDDKENQPLPSTKSKRPDAAKSTGLRAKPLRKPSRTRKTASNTDKTEGVDDKKSESNVKRMPHILTPKKITQVARVCTPDESDEDELNGGKTPVRDLAMSPRRPTDSALGRAISPAKKIDLNQSSAIQPMTSISGVEQSAGILASPARRPPTSPFKDAMKNSPKRSDAVKLLFPDSSQTQTSIHASLALNPSNLNSASQNMSNLLASPKRIGIVDTSFFSQSSMKPKADKSPFKASLLASPARRLFSPNKKATEPTISKISEMTLDNSEDENKTLQESEAAEIEDDIVVSSHFRASVSPARPVRLSRCHGDELDFDESVLPIASPLKVLQRPAKSVVLSNSTMPEVSQSEKDKLTPADASCAHDVSRNHQEVIHMSQVESVATLEHALSCQDEVDVLVEDNAAANQSPIQVIKVSSAAELPAECSNSKPADEIEIFSPRDSAVDEDTSEDETIDQATPVQRLPKQRKSLATRDEASRLSLGVPPSAAGKGFGFTPLADQMNGWLASSPQKASTVRKPRSHRDGSFEFSPLAAQHVDGQVVISRNSTPVQKLNLRKSMTKVSLAGSALKTRQSLGPRRSMAGRQSLATESPARDTQFEEYMEMRALEQESAALREDSIFVDQAGEEFDEVIDINGADQDEDDVNGDTVLIDNLEDDCNENQPADLTTDLVKSTHATDTAIIDFEELAAEADELAEVAMKDQIDSPVLQPTVEHLDSPSMLVIDANSPDKVPSQPEQMTVSSPPEAATVGDTPIRPAMDFSVARMFNTVVSKVPLKPEGVVSPIKIPKKRARSFGNADMGSNKRFSFGNLKQVAIPDQPAAQSPDRRVRTSAAPSPGGTSTPASRYSRASFGTASAFTTPGQTSFVVDDFGDSTLDGIEIPEDFDASRLLQSRSQENSPAVTELNFDAEAAPRQVQHKTPVTARSSTSRAVTPATAVKSTKKASRTSGSRQSLTKVSRTPLGSIGKGVLDGAVVYVDVHTSEGADASGVFIDLLTQMGARCVKDWRWNPRVSLASADSEDSLESRIGITHVVYKDGGKRTLEKVRDAKGEVWCVGVAWVLDCERENKWLDETTYAIDAAILPRGGSKRRKSMEPRALLLNGDGSLSANKARRSVSAEVSELMKRELINTPIRHRVSSDSNNDVDHEDDQENEDVENDATPTGYVAYDPRVAMTPGTPYLVSQGKKLVQMSAPPKQQTGKRLFEDVDDDDDDENDSSILAQKNQESESSRGSDAAVRDAKKFRMRNLDLKARRKTMNNLAGASGFNRPVVGSPLAKI